MYLLLKEKQVCHWNKMLYLHLICTFFFQANDKELSLENTVVAVSTTEDGLDGLPPLKRVNLDEIPKMAEAEAILTKTKEQLKLQSEKQGIIEMTSYPPEDDTKSFKFCKNLHTKDCFDLDEEGYPKNGIMPLYIGLAESTKGTHDVFGEPDKLKAVFLEKAERAKLDTPAKLQARKRQYHFNVKESWESGGSGSTYNNIALAEASAVLEEMYKQGELNYVEGNLEWTAGIYSPVRFVPLTFDEIMNGAVGKWKFYCTMDYLKNNTNLCFNMPRKKKKEGKTIVELLQPPDDVIHCAGTDPVDYAYAGELGKVQSKISSVVKDLSGNLISVYHFRSEDPDESLEDLMMEMIFLGTYSLVEGNRKVAVTFLEKSLMYCFILIRHPKGEILPYKQTVPIKHVNSSKDVISKYITLVIKRIKHNLSQLKSLPIIEQHKEFDAQDTQPYDLSVADGLCEIAIESMQNYVMMKKMTTDKYKYLGVALDYAF